MHIHMSLNQQHFTSFSVLKPTILIIPVKSLLLAVMDFDFGIFQTNLQIVQEYLPSSNFESTTGIVILPSQISRRSRSCILWSTRLQPPNVYGVHVAFSILFLNIFFGMYCLVHEVWYFLPFLIWPKGV